MRPRRIGVCYLPRFYGAVHGKPRMKKGDKAVYVMNGYKIAVHIPRSKGILVKNHTCVRRKDLCHAAPHVKSQYTVRILKHKKILLTVYCFIYSMRKFMAYYSVNGAKNF